MQRVEYQPLIVDKEPVEEPKSCHSSFQDITFVISLAVQLAVLIFSLVTLGIGNPPPLLQLILVLETVVQAVEFCWYAVIGGLYFFKKMTFSVAWRYVDWVITTPVMLITLFFLVIYFHEPCMETGKLVDFPGFAGLLALIVLADWAMLLVGVIVEANLCEIRKKRWAWYLLFLGFIPLCLAFIPHVLAASERPSESAVAVIVPTFVLWGLYGVVAIAAYGDDRAQWRNGFYNVLGKSTARPPLPCTRAHPPPLHYRPALEKFGGRRRFHHRVRGRLRGGAGRRGRGRAVVPENGNEFDLRRHREPAAGAAAGGRAQLDGWLRVHLDPGLLLRLWLDGDMVLSQIGLRQQQHVWRLPPVRVW